MSDQYTEIEIKIAFLEQNLQKLSDEHFEQQQEINKLKKANKILQSQIDTLSESVGEEAPIIDDKPPHY
jgi:uncharacterized coiled-coil protein SlyX